jgi:glucose-6-phosphate isomerase
VTALERLAEADAVTRLRERDASLFALDIDQRIPIGHRLGWTDLASKAPARLPLLDGLAEALRAEGATDVILLGMGGSSLAPYVMSAVIGSASGFPRLHVLDTTSPVGVSETLDELDPQTTFVLISSKSGTTIEPLSLYAVVRAWLEASGMSHPEAGRRCIVITDPGSALEKLRQRDVMRLALAAPVTVGGRYSALSMFGLAPAALIGIHLPSLIARAQAMEHACAYPLEVNPGALLGAWIADAWEAGQDKLTVVCSDALRPLGLWIEQLVAESLGKDGTGVVPVIEYAPSSPPGYADDRAVVVLRFKDDAPLAAWSHEIAASHPVFELTATDVFDIGAEFVRWEYAIALAGFLLGVNPFDELAVTEAKEATATILDGDAEQVPHAIADFDGTWVTYAGALDPPLSMPTSRTGALRDAVRSLGPEDHLAVLAYIADDESRVVPLRDACSVIARATGRAAGLQLGPRYLHSTGQLHKAGPDNGVFVLVTARDRTDVKVPGRPFTLGQLHRAQAEGDLVTLARHGRRIVRLDLPDSDPATLAALAGDLTIAASAGI